MAHEEIDREIRDVVAFAHDEQVLDRWYVRKLAPPFLWSVALLVGIPTLGVAALLYWLFWRLFIYRAEGYLLLTNVRILYYERGRSVTRRHRHVASLDVVDIAGARLFARKGVWRLLGLVKLRDYKAMYLNIFTDHFDAISIGAVKTVGKDIFEPADDMIAAVHELGARIREVQAQRGAAV